MWINVFLSLAKLLGPLLLDWLKERLADEAKKLDADETKYGLVYSVPINQDARLVLLERVRASLWFYQIGKHRVIDTAITAVRSAQ